MNGTKPPNARPVRQLLQRQFARFVGVGAANTILTFVLYEILILYLPYSVGYTISFVAGIAFAALANSRLVFRIRLESRNTIRFIVFYVSSYFLGLFLMVVAVEKLGLPVAIAPFFLVAVMLPFNFFGSRLALSRK
jgi:putative flippase GtrA